MESFSEYLLENEFDYFQRPKEMTKEHLKAITEQAKVLNKAMAAAMKYATPPSPGYRIWGIHGKRPALEAIWNARAAIKEIEKHISEMDNDWNGALGRQ